MYLCVAHMAWWPNHTVTKWCIVAFIISYYSYSKPDPSNGGRHILGGNIPSLCEKRMCRHIISKYVPRHINFAQTFCQFDLRTINIKLLTIYPSITIKEVFFVELTLVLKSSRKRATLFILNLCLGGALGEWHRY